MRAVTIKGCTRLVADATRLKPEYLRLPTRRRAIARPRQIAMWLARKATNRAYADIAAYLGLSDHSTAVHAFQNIERLRTCDPDILELTDRLLDRVTA